MDYPDDRKTGRIATPHLFSTIRVGRVDSETGEVVEALYDQAASYQEAISLGMETFSTEEYLSNDLMRYFKLPDNPQVEATIKEKIRSARVTVEAVGETLFARLDLDMAADLTIQESAALIEQIKFQYRDGWGAEFELQTIQTENGAVCLRLWHDDVSFFADGFKADFAQQCSWSDAEFYPILYPNVHKCAVSVQNGPQSVRPSVRDALQDKVKSAEYPFPDKLKPPKKHAADKETR